MGQHFGVIDFGQTFNIAHQIAEIAFDVEEHAIDGFCGGLLGFELG